MADHRRSGAQTRGCAKTAPLVWVYTLLGPALLHRTFGWDS